MKFSGFTILQGVEFSIFPIDFEWALQQCSATALPVMILDLHILHARSPRHSIGQVWRSVSSLEFHRHRNKNDAEVVGATSSKDFL